MTREELVAERLALELTVAATFAELRASPVFRAYAMAEQRLIEHRALYGTGDLTREPKGLLDFGDPGAFEP